MGADIKKKKKTGAYLAVVLFFLLCLELGPALAVLLCELLHRPPPQDENEDEDSAHYKGQALKEMP